MKHWCNNVDWSLESVLPNINNGLVANQLQFAFLKYLISAPSIEGIENDILEEANAMMVCLLTPTPRTQTQDKYKKHYKR